METGQEGANIAQEQQNLTTMVGDDTGVQSTSEAVTASTAREEAAAAAAKITSLSNSETDNTGKLDATVETDETTNSDKYRQ